MMQPPSDARRQDNLLAWLLRLGTWTACVLVIGGASASLPALSTYPLFAAIAGLGLAKAGIAVLILLPVTRVALMLVLFLKDRDYAHMAIAALVLAIIATGYFSAR
jgi:uncharacterized membrane protein YraQ (UPF0718 family)